MANSTFCCRHGVESTALFFLSLFRKDSTAGHEARFWSQSLYWFQLNNFRFQLVLWQTEPVLSLKCQPSAQLLRGKAQGNNPCLHLTPDSLPCFTRKTKIKKNGTQPLSISSHCWAQRHTQTSLHDVCVFRGSWSVPFTNRLRVQSTHRRLCKDCSVLVQYPRVDPSQSHEVSSGLFCRSPFWPSPAFIYSHTALMRFHACDQSQKLGCSNGACTTVLSKSWSIFEESW